MSRACGEKGGEGRGGGMDDKLMISRGAQAMCGFRASGKVQVSD